MSPICNIHHAACISHHMNRPGSTRSIAKRLCNVPLVQYAKTPREGVLSGLMEKHMVDCRSLGVPRWQDQLSELTWSQPWTSSKCSLGLFLFVSLSV